MSKSNPPNKSRGGKRKSSGSADSVASVLHNVVHTQKSKADHLKSKLAALAETEIAKAISGPVDLEEEGFEFESLGPGSSYCRDGTEIRTKEQAKAWRKEKMTTFDHYYAPDKHGRWKRRKRSGGVLKKEAITLFPEHGYILRALDSLGLDICPLTRKLADKVTDAFDRIDPNENVILTSIHPNAGCLHIDLITTRFCRPTPELDKITLKNQNTRQGNNRSAHAGPALIALLRLRERGLWPDEISRDLDRFLRKRERATESLPTDYLVCDIVDRFLEEELPKLYKGIPHLEKAVEKAKTDYKQHIELVAAKRLEEYKVANGKIAPDETLEKLKREKEKRDQALAETETLEKESLELEKAKSSLSEKNSKLTKEIKALESFASNKALYLKNFEKTKTEVLNLKTEYAKLLKQKERVSAKIIELNAGIESEKEIVREQTKLAAVLDEILDSQKSLEVLVVGALENFEKEPTKKTYEDFFRHLIALTQDCREMLSQGFDTLDSISSKETLENENTDPDSFEKKDGPEPEL